jgi:hypothetical protein
MTDQQETIVYEDEDGAPYPEAAQKVMREQRHHIGLLSEAIVKIAAAGGVEVGEMTGPEVLALAEDTADHLRHLTRDTATARNVGAKALLDALLEGEVLEKAWVIGGPPNAVWVKGRLSAPHVDVSLIVGGSND